MTDKELLELAAKAAGVEVTFDIDGTAWKKWPSFKWNPLTDDGDALRLAVKLRMEVCIDTSMSDVDGCTEAHLGDPYTATRRAIVRASAAIGEKL